MDLCSKHAMLNTRGAHLGCRPTQSTPHHRHLSTTSWQGLSVADRGPQLMTRADGKGGDKLTSEEEAFFSEVLARRKEERQRALREAARRSKLYAEKRRLAELQASEGGTRPPVDTPVPPSPSAPAPPLMQPPARPRAALNKPAPPPADVAPIRPLQQQPVLPRPVPQKPTQPAAPSLPQPAKRRSAGLPKVIRPRKPSVSLKKRAPPPNYNVSIEDDDEDIDDDTLSALDDYASQLLGKSAGRVAATPSTKQAPRQTAPKADAGKAGAGKAGAASSQLQRVAQRGGGAIQSAEDAEAQFMKQLQAMIDDDSDSDDDEDGRLPDLVNMDDIDWEALEAYEQFEQSSETAYVPPMPLTTTGAMKQWLQPHMNRPGRPNSQQSATSQPQSPQAASASTSTSSRSSSQADNSSQASAAGRAGQGQQEEPDVQTMLKMLDELQLVGEQQQAGQATGALGEAGGDTALAAWEEMLLGKDWQERELGSLNKQVASLSGSRGNPDEQIDTEGAPWADEVTSLLTGLVLMSAKRYLNRDLLPEDTEEEQRATKVWEAPWALLVLDDSKKGCLEYANKQAMSLLGISEFEDVYDLTMYDLLGPRADDQQDWLWAMNEVEDNGVSQAVVPSVKLVARGEGRDAAGKSIKSAQVIIAKDVQLFRIDSLGDDGCVGTAVLITSVSTLVRMPGL